MTDLGRLNKKQTLKYHYDISKIVFGESSEAVKFLEEKAKESPNGFDEEVVANEGQVVHLLMSLHFKGAEESSRDEFKKLLNELL